MLHQHSEGFLAPYALKSKNSKGRKYPESTHPVRTYYQRDTARIVHSRPFRRLEYKTQVFLNGTGDHYRTRLTHTMEVSITARTIARTLNLNEDLTEAISLAHDLGHTPFGHIGEYALNAALEPYERGFEHNLHSLRIVDELTLKYPNFQGLNLSWETRLGLLKHRNPGQTLDNIEIPLNLSLEGQVADIADDLTYYAHDIDDGITSGLISVNMLDELEIWQQIREIISKDGVSENSERFVAYALRALINLMATDVLENSSQNIKKYNINTPEQPQNIQESLIVFSPHMEKITKELKSFLYANIYRNKALKSINSKTADIITSLFNLYLKQPELMGHTANDYLTKDKYDIYTVATDYVAGMTDRFAFNEYKKYFDE